MKEVYIIIEEYYDSEGYTHRKPFNEFFYLSEEEANKVIDAEKKRCMEEWDPDPDLRVMKLKRNEEE